MDFRSGSLRAAPIRRPAWTSSTSKPPILTMSAKPIISAAPSSGSSNRMADELTLGSDRTLVVVGASLAGLRAVESARREGFEGRIVLIGEEPPLPYDRPPLSKGFISGQVADSSYHKLATFTDDLRVELILGSQATGLHVQRQEIHTDNGVVPYDSLVLATGSTPRRIPGVPDLFGIHLLRTKEHAKAIRESITRGTRVVVLGGGFIGAEVASSCRSLDAHVTIIEAAGV